MRETSSSSQCVVVGIDGSRSALKAALWAVDEALKRDVALRLVCAIGSSESEPAAKDAVRNTIAAVESTRKPVKVDGEIVHGRPVAVLMAESRSAAMVCVGSTGLKHATYGHIGSTASALVNTAHCPVALVPISALQAPTGHVLVVVDESLSSSAVLELAVQEARFRGAPLRVLSSWPPRGYGRHDVDEAAAAAARVERCLTPWRRNHPTIDIQLIASHGSVVTYLEYLHRNDEAVQLLVVDPRRAGPTEMLLGPSGRAALDATHCILLICDRQRWL
jgi:nucleotide-binding universal stress UspA family protein